MGALQMMDFEGIDAVRENIAQGQTLLNIVQQQQMEMAQMAGLLQQSLGLPPTQEQLGQEGANNGMNAFNAMEQGPTSVTPQMAPNQQNPDNPGRGYGMADRVMGSKQKAMTPYGKTLADRSKAGLE